MDQINQPEQLDTEDEYITDIENKYYATKAMWAGRASNVEAGTNTIADQSNLSVLLESVISNQSTIGTLVERLSTSAPEPPGGSTNSNENNRHEGARLPRIELPEFDGSYLNWIRFRDLFESMVHSKSNPSCVEKFEYLQGRLRGDALSMVRHLKPTTDNYPFAWQLIKNKYDNATHIKRAYYELIFDHPSIKTPNVGEIKRFYNCLNEGVNALMALDEPVSSWDSILLFHLERKLDGESNALWCREVKGSSATFNQFLKFLEQRMLELEKCQPVKVAAQPSILKHQQTHYKLRNQPAIHTTIVQSCIVCQQQHLIYKCPKFKDLNIEERIKLVRTKQLCFNCLQQSHRAHECKSSLCKLCNGKHNTLLHRNQGVGSADRSQSDQQVVNEQQRLVGINAVQQGIGITITLLPTVIILVQGNDLTFHPIRALQDSGAQATLITESCVQRLGLKRQYDKTWLCGVEPNNTSYTKGKLELTIKSSISEDVLVTEALCLSNLTQMQPPYKVDSNKFEFFKDLKLADPNCNVPNRIKIILGADMFCECVLNERIVHPTGAPTAMSTIFGWVILGKVPVKQEKQIWIAHVSVDFSEQLHRFWELEEIQEDKQFLTNEEQQAEDHYQKNTQKNSEGRFIVRLPFKSESYQLEVNKSAALRRLHNMEHRFVNNESLQNEYRKFMNEFKQLDHMELICNEDVITRYYMPHHAVIKPSSSTTKLRVVFDASSKGSNGRSLNDELLVGPTIQSDLFSIILQFRKYRIGLAGDIEKMYRLILIHPEDQKYQGILWRDDKNQQVDTYHLKTVTYGTAAAPFLAIRTLKQVAIEIEGLQPHIAEAIKHCFYVDDFMSCAPDITSAMKLKEELCEVLAASGFNLRKWCTNSSEVLQSINVNDREQSAITMIDTENEVKTLGLLWNTHEDTFKYSVMTPTNSKEITKRTLLSTISKVFDPIGWLSPVVVKMKIFMQQLWLKGLDWDQPLPDNLRQKWCELNTSIQSITQLKIPRWVQYSKEQGVELHGFSDSSELAYAATIYLKIIHQDGNISTNLIAAKTKVAPVKQVTLPRLELCAAHLMVKLLVKVKNAMGIPLSGIHGWSDSTIVLAWLSDHPRRWKNFVANRTSYIINILPAQQWHHIASKENPADLATRGILPEELLCNKLWWHGPPILQETDFKIKALDISTSVDMEERNTLVYHASTSNVELFELYSSFNKVVRITARILRFTQNCRPRQFTYTAGNLTSEELQAAQKRLAKRAQQLTYAAEIRQLSLGNQLAANHKLAPLVPFLDNDGVMRVGGRLQNASISYDQKHPIILHKDSKYVWMIVTYYHLKYLHTGPRQLQYLLSLKYWIPSVTYVIKKCVYQCVTCVRMRSKPYEQQMGILPKARLDVVAAFYNTGVDFAGPIQLRAWKGRGSKQYKGWIAIFVCLATKDLTTAAFLATLRRFVARRGKPANMYSDNGTNFVGCNQAIAEFIRFLNKSTTQDDIMKEVVHQGVEWHFSPPAGPHFGGLWEAGVKSVKFHLNRILKNVAVTYEEFVTILAQIEAYLNSRPLCIKFQGDCDPLTPAHFLTQRSMEALADPDVSSHKLNRLTRWQYLQHIIQVFWKKWSNDYLNQMQRRPKWANKIQNLTRNDIVILKDDHLPPTQWILGRIIDTHPSTDGLVRVVTIQTTKGCYKRPVQKLCPLFVDC